jgi:mannose-6-phosphate isomerase-like protein (cupin superfamily)
MSDANLTTASAGELLKVGPTRIRVLEDGSRTDNRIGAIASLLPAGVSGPRQHRHLMHDETFLITSGILRFTLGDTHRDAKVGDDVVVPVGAPRTFANVSDEPVEFFSTFTPAYYVNYFRELAHLSAEGRSDPEEMLSLMLRYATVPC